MSQRSLWNTNLAEVSELLRLTDLPPPLDSLAQACSSPGSKLPPALPSPRSLGPETRLPAPHPRHDLEGLCNLHAHEGKRPWGNCDSPPPKLSFSCSPMRHTLASSPGRTLSQVTLKSILLPHHPPGSGSPNPSWHENSSLIHLPLLRAVHSEGILCHRALIPTQGIWVQLSHFIDEMMEARNQEVTCQGHQPGGTRPGFLPHHHTDHSLLSC